MGNHGGDSGGGAVVWCDWWWCICKYADTYSTMAVAKFLLLCGASRFQLQWLRSPQRHRFNPWCWFDPWPSTVSWMIQHFHSWSLDSVPCLGTYICHGVSHYKKKQQEKNILSYKWTLINLSTDFSAKKLVGQERVSAGRKKLPTRILYLAKLSFRNEGKIKTFPNNKKNLR